MEEQAVKVRAASARATMVYFIRPRIEAESATGDNVFLQVLQDCPPGEMDQGRISTGTPSGTLL